MKPHFYFDEDIEKNGIATYVICLGTPGIRIGSNVYLNLDELHKKKILTELISGITILSSSGSDIKNSLIVNHKYKLYEKFQTEHDQVVTDLESFAEELFYIGNKTDNILDDSGYGNNSYWGNEEFYKNVVKKKVDGYHSRLFELLTNQKFIEKGQRILHNNILLITGLGGGTGSGASGHLLQELNKSINWYDSGYSTDFRLKNLSNYVLSIIPKIPTNIPISNNNEKCFKNHNPTDLIKKINVIIGLCNFNKNIYYFQPSLENHAKGIFLAENHRIKLALELDINEKVNMESDVHIINQYMSRHITIPLLFFFKYAKDLGMDSYDFNTYINADKSTSDTSGAPYLIPCGYVAKNNKMNFAEVVKRAVKTVFADIRLHNKQHAIYYYNKIDDSIADEEVEEYIKEIIFEEYYDNEDYINFLGIIDSKNINNHREKFMIKPDSINLSTKVNISKNDQRSNKYLKNNMIAIYFINPIMENIHRDLIVLDKSINNKPSEDITDIQSEYWDKREIIYHTLSKIVGSLPEINGDGI